MIVYLQQRAFFGRGKFLNSFLQLVTYAKFLVMKKIIFSVFLTLVVIMGAILIYIYSGSYNVSQLVPHNAVTKWAITTTSR